MDPDTLRLILLVVGVIFILALYLWERSRGPDEGDEEEPEYADEDAPYATTSRPRQEPNLGRLGGEAPARAAEPDPAELDVTQRIVGDHLADDGLADDDLADDVAPLLIQLSVAKRKGEFTGTEIMETAGGAGLRPGEMDIFHCLDKFDDDTRIYFSMANMVKPGTFPFDAMEDFRTPGLMLFAQLDGRPEDLTILEEMIATARKLATTLGGDVLDDTRRPLTVRKEEEMRMSVLEHEMRRTGAPAR